MSKKLFVSFVHKWSLHQDADLNHNKKLANKSFESVTELRHSGMKLEW